MPSNSVEGQQGQQDTSDKSAIELISNAPKQTQTGDTTIQQLGTEGVILANVVSEAAQITIALPSKTVLELLKYYLYLTVKTAMEVLSTTVFVAQLMGKDTSLLSKVLFPLLASAIIAIPTWIVNDHQARARFSGMKDRPPLSGGETSVFHELIAIANYVPAPSVNGWLWGGYAAGDHKALAYVLSPLAALFNSIKNLYVSLPKFWPEWQSNLKAEGKPYPKAAEEGVLLSWAYVDVVYTFLGGLFVEMSPVFSGYTAYRTTIDLFEDIIGVPASMEVKLLALVMAEFAIYNFTFFDNYRLHMASQHRENDWCAKQNDHQIQAIENGTAQGCEPITTGVKATGHCLASVTHASAQALRCALRMPEAENTHYLIDYKAQGLKSDWRLVRVAASVYSGAIVPNTMYELGLNAATISFAGALLNSLSDAITACVAVAKYISSNDAALITEKDYGLLTAFYMGDKQSQVIGTWLQPTLQVTFSLLILFGFLTQYGNLEESTQKHLDTKGHKPLMQRLLQTIHDYLSRNQASSVSAPPSAAVSTAALQSQPYTKIELTRENPAVESVNK